MKKWLAACLLAIALLFAATTAMAGHNKANGEYCLGGSYALLKEYENQHLLRCNDCQEEILENHWIGQEATCIRKAECGTCTKRFGEYGPHDWGEWKSIGRGAHTRTCKHKSDHVETEDCTFSVAPCDDYSPCTKCGAYSKLGHDWGGWTPNGDKTHTRVCKRDSSHTETQDCGDFWDADCTTPAMCVVCWGTHGETDPSRHDWGRFPNSNGNGTHTYICYLDSSHTKTEDCSGSGALCGETDWCDDCLERYTVGHKLDGIWVSDADGHWQTCIQCNESQSKAPHSFVELADAKYLKSEATCVSGAVYYKACSACGHHATDTFESGDKNPYNHDLAPREAKDPTCTEDGWTAHEACQREGCGYLTPHKLISYDGHSLIPYNGKTPTCTEPGWKAYEVCNRRICDYTTYQELPIDPDNHDLAHHEAKAPTCTEKGWSAYDTCTRCDYTTYAELAALDHDWSNWVSNGNKTHTRTCKNDPDHIQRGSCSGVSCGETGACAVCGGEYTVAHEYIGQWISDGADAHWRDCILCGAGRETASHSFSEYPDSKATCVSPAKYLKICFHCFYREIIERGDIDPNNHNLAHHEAQAPTCTEIGWEAYDTCSRCAYTTYTELPAGGHDLIRHAAQAPTCTEKGWKEYDTCSRCDHTTYVELPAGGHDLIRHSGKVPTCTEKGWKEYDTCSRCDYTTYRELDALGHSYEASTVQPTCTKEGHTLHTCARCKASYTDAVVSSRGHWYGEWSPNGDAASSADCRRNGCRHTGKALCEPLVCRLLIEDAETYDFTLCPVCGEVSDGARLTLIKEARATAQRLPRGALVLRIGDLQNGERVLSVGFEYGGRLTQPTEQVEITLPAELLDGYALMLLDADGAETALSYTLNGDEATFTLDFTADESPALALRLIPVS